jgi:hypothetical protein
VFPVTTGSHGMVLWAAAFLLSWMCVGQGPPGGTTAWLMLCGMQLGRLHGCCVVLMLSIAA